MPDFECIHIVIFVSQIKRDKKLFKKVKLHMLQVLNQIYTPWLPSIFKAILKFSNNKRTNDSSFRVKTNLEYQLEMASLKISKELYEILQKNKKDRIDLIKKKEFDLLPDNIVKYTDIIFDFIQQGTESDIEFNFSFNCKKI